MRDLLALSLFLYKAEAFLFNPELLLNSASQLMRLSDDANANLCSEKIFQYTNNPSDSNIFNTLFVSTGKSLNDLGNYEKCQSMPGVLKYALVTISSADTLRQRIQMGLCVPEECNSTSLEFFNKLY